MFNVSREKKDETINKEVQNSTVSNLVKDHGVIMHKNYAFQTPMKYGMGNPKNPAARNGGAFGPYIN